MHGSKSPKMIVKHIEPAYSATKSDLRPWCPHTFQRPVQVSFVSMLRYCLILHSILTVQSFLELLKIEGEVSYLPLETELQLRRGQE